MRVILLGAGGFIGRHILADLLRHGHEVIAVVRSIDGLDRAFPGVEFERRDLTRMTSAEAWRPLLNGVDAVINAAGVLSGRNMTAVHVDAPRALHRACAQAAVRRVVLISAISARADVNTDYARSKLAGAADLRAAGLSWTILRPSLVYADGSYGGTSLMRGMAGLPWFTPVPGDGRFAFTPIHARDLARAARIAAEGDGFEGATLAPAGPATLTLCELLALYRGWLGFGNARFVRVPMVLVRLAGRCGDLFGGGPIATNSLAQMIAGNEGDGELFARAIGFQPRALAEALRDSPAQVQDRWHARLFFLAPMLRWVLAAVWLASALLGLFRGAPMTVALTGRLGLPSTLLAPAQVGSSLLDFGVAALVLLDRRARWSTLVQTIVVLGYTLVIGVALPRLWLDPFGPLLKNAPVLLAILVHGAIGNRR